MNFISSSSGLPLFDFELNIFIRSVTLPELFHRTCNDNFSSINFAAMAFYRTKNLNTYSHIDTKQYESDKANGT